MSFISNLKKLACASKQNVLELGTSQYLKILVHQSFSKKIREEKYGLTLFLVSLVKPIKKSL